MRDVFSGHVSKEGTDSALSLLLELGLVYPEMVKTHGRPAERWFAVRAHARKAREAREVSGSSAYSASRAFRADAPGPESAASNALDAFRADEDGPDDDEHGDGDDPVEVLL